VKQRLQIRQGRSFEELQENVHGILSFIGLTELAEAMRVWIARLQRIININREDA
jgi:hypothetical protein